MLQNIKSYIINLEKYKNKYELCLKRLSKLNIKPERFNAIYVEDENSEEIRNITHPSVQYTIKNKRFSHNNMTSKGAIGCYLSHITLWKMLLESNEEYFLIFEDDVEINYYINNIENIINKILNLNNWDFVYLGYLDSYVIFNMFSNPKEIISRIQNITFCTHSYLINRKGAEILLNKALPIVDQIDSYISFMSIANYANIYKSNEILFIQNNIITSSTCDTFSIKPYITQWNDEFIIYIIILIILIIFMLLYLLIMCQKKCLL